MPPTGPCPTCFPYGPPTRSLGAFGRIPAWTLWKKKPKKGKKGKKKAKGK
jgi:hypothetical protein